MARGDSESFRVRSAHQYAKIESEIKSWCEKSADIYPNSMEHMIAGGSRALIISSARTTIKRQKKKHHNRMWPEHDRTNTKHRENVRKNIIIY